MFFIPVFSLWHTCRVLLSLPCSAADYVKLSIFLISNINNWAIVHDKKITFWATDDMPLVVLAEAYYYEMEFKIEKTQWEELERVQYVQRQVTLPRVWIFWQPVTESLLTPSRSMLLCNTAVSAEHATVLHVNCVQVTGVSSQGQILCMFSSCYRKQDVIIYVTITHLLQARRVLKSHRWQRKICDYFVVVKSERRKVFGEFRNYSGSLAVSIGR